MNNGRLDEHILSLLAQVYTEQQPYITFDALTEPLQTSAVTLLTQLSQLAADDVVQVNLWGKHVALTRKGVKQLLPGIRYRSPFKDVSRSAMIPTANDWHYCLAHLTHAVSCVHMSVAQRQASEHALQKLSVALQHNEFMGLAIDSWFVDLPHSAAVGMWCTQLKHSLNNRGAC